jgi:hypothetical protein
MRNKTKTSGRDRKEKYMNTSFLAIVKRIAAQQDGEKVLCDAKRLKAFFSDLARDEPKPLRTAFCCAVEEGAYNALKGAPDAAERASRKASIAQRVRNEHGLDVSLCADALDILEAALFGTVSPRPQTAPPPPQPAPPQYRPLSQAYAPHQRSGSAGSHVYKHLPAIINYCKNNPVELDLLCNDQYSKRMFDLNFPFFIDVNNIDESNPKTQSKRYKKEMYSVNNKRVRLTSQWFEWNIPLFYKYLSSKGINP